MANTELLASYSKFNEAIRELNAHGINVEYSIKKESKKDYEVVIREIYTTVVPIKAFSPSVAKEMALKAIEEGTVQVDFRREPTEVEIDVWDAADDE